MSKKAITTASLLLFALYLYAQIPSQLIFSRLTKKDGLVSNTTFQTVRDPQGFLWIGTQNGLQRYDGHRFLTFRHVPGQSNSILENTINHLFLDSRQRLWLVFGKRAGIFNTLDFNFSETKVSTPINMIRKIMEDAEGRILVFADGKQFVFDETKQSFDSTYTLPSLPAGYTVSDMAVDPVSGYYWLTGRQGALLYDPKSKKTYSKEQNSIKDLALDSMGTVKNARYPFVGKDGTPWIVSWIPFAGPPPVLYSYDRKRKQFQRFEKIREFKQGSYYEIWNVFQQSNGTIWAYGMGLLAYFDPAEKRFIHITSDPFKQNGIEYTYVSNLYEDKEKNVWVCTNEGIYRFNTEAQVFRNMPNRRYNDTALYRNAVSSIVSTQNKEIWISTWGAGVFSYNNLWQPTSNPFMAADPSNYLMHCGSMIQRRNGEIWVGTQFGQLKIYEPATNKYFSVSPPLLRGEMITQLLEDRLGNTWIGTNSGLLVKCSNGNWRDTTQAYSSALTEVGDILNLYEDNNNHIWVCSAVAGLYEVDIRDGHLVKEFRANPDNNEGLLTDGATDIIQYNDSTLLVASEGLCILNIKTNKFTYLSPADGLPAEHITNLILDKQKRLWVACDGGLYRLNIQNKLYVTYDAADGISNDVFQVGSATLLPDGRVVFGTPNDFLTFDPEQAIDRKEPPPVQITGFVLNNRYLPVDSLQKLENVILSHDNTFLRVELSTLSFRDDYYMYYMLEGLDKVWKQVANNEITYQFLPPGDYTLLLKSKNGEDVESKTITRLKIQVDPPFWKTWWFYSILALFLIGLLYWFDHERIKRKTAILKMRSNIADDLHKDVNATLSSITILSAMAKMKADREPEKSKELIEEINSKSQNMSQAMDDILWSIDPGNDSMDKLALRLREHIDALKSEHNVRIDMEVDKRAEELQFKMKLRNDIFWFFKNGITNVVSSGATNCRIRIAYQKPNLIYRVEFDSANLDVKKLDSLRQRAELLEKLEELHAKLDFKEHNTDAVFILSIPIKTNGL